MRYGAEWLLEQAHAYAKQFSGCLKVQVGSIIVNESLNRILSFGANRAIPDLCKYRGCLRVEKYGNNNKEHRAPGDCRAIHSEVDAIASAGCDLRGACIVVTRYPCESCARAIVAAGITRVIYGRQQKVSEETMHIFEDAAVQVIHLKNWDAPDAIN